MSSLTSIIVASGAGLLIGLVIGARRGRRAAGSDGSAAEGAHLRRQVTRAQRMEALGILSGSLMHNLNNLLSVVLGQARLARDLVVPDSDQWRHLGQVIQAAETAAELSREVDSFHREDDDGRHPVRLQPVVRATVKLLRDILPDSVDIESELDPACGTVLASPPQLQQMLMSLCSNSYHAMFRRRGSIKIALEPAVVDQLREAVPRDLTPGHYVRLTVSDNGRGMDVDTIQHMFEPYFSAQSPNPGAGLGLTVVARLLAANEGVAVASSRPGHGSSFELYFPVIARGVRRGDREQGAAELRLVQPGEQPPTVEPVDEPELPAARLNRPAHILLVEDDPLVSDTVRACLERAELRVTAFADGASAVTAFGADPGAFDLVLTDQLLAGLDGREVVREIRRLRPRLPAIIMSGHPEGIRDDDVASLHLAGTLAKPFTPAELLGLVRHALRPQARTLEGEA
ncbi:response regulator [bacterium]|nr:response regulator [bacterium]